MTVITLRMPDHLIEELKAVARDNERTLSQEARLALKHWLTLTADPRKAAA